MAEIASVGVAETRGGLPRCGPKRSRVAGWRDAGRSGDLEFCVAMSLSLLKFVGQASLVDPVFDRDAGREGEPLRGNAQCHRTAPEARDRPQGPDPGSPEKRHCLGRQGGIVTLSDCKLFSACLHEAKPLTLRRAAIDNLPRFGVNPVNVTKPSRPRVGFLSVD